MMLFCRKNLVNGLRCAVVLGGIGLGFVSPPPAHAFGMTSADSTESFASQAQGDDTFSPEAPLHQWQYGAGDFDGPAWSNTNNSDAGGATNKYSDSFGHLAFEHRWDNGFGWHGQGEDWRPFHGGGWWHEHWHCDDCGKTTSPVPETGTTTLLIVGLLALGIVLGGLGRRPLLRIR
ncbi:MAG TPA: hypothetical protein VEE84_10300 [Burkholderiaceae bacterium]|nr:hypothetical protein [Burkholderiaceae bacterium]